jgi:hypothetical protein
MLSAADLEAARALEPTVPDTDELSPLTTISSVIAYTATAARTEGSDEADAAELAVRLADLSPDTVRHTAATLRALGYAEVATRLRLIAGRRKRDLAPLA